jgi:hypothetical protein
MRYEDLASDAPLTGEHAVEADDTASFQKEFMADLRAQLRVWEEALALAERENQALVAVEDYQSFSFHRERKDLLPRLDRSLMVLRKWRQSRSLSGLAARADCSEANLLVQAVQALLMKALLMDKENQQALLKRGLVPARHLPSSAVQQPHYVADLYRRHARS